MAAPERASSYLLAETLNFFVSKIDNDVFFSLREEMDSMHLSAEGVFNRMFTAKLQGKTLETAFYLVYLREAHRGSVTAQRQKECIAEALQIEMAQADPNDSFQLGKLKDWERRLALTHPY